LKTTIELPDELLIRAKTAAAQRKTTLRAIFEHALRREVGQEGADVAVSPHFIVGADGMPRIRHRGRQRVTSALVRELLEEEG
jgi:Arc/MetJ family transcription regulator